MATEDQYQNTPINTVILQIIQNAETYTRDVLAQKKAKLLIPNPLPQLQKDIFTPLKELMQQNSWTANDTQQLATILQKIVAFQKKQKIIRGVFVFLMLLPILAAIPFMAVYGNTNSVLALLAIITIPSLLHGAFVVLANRRNSVLRPVESAVDNLRVNTQSFFNSQQPLAGVNQTTPLLLSNPAS